MCCYLVCPSLFYVMWLIVAVSLDCPLTCSNIYSACSSQNPFSSCLISRALIGATIRVQLVVQKLFILQEHLRLSLVFRGGGCVVLYLDFGICALTTIICFYSLAHCILLRLTASDALWCLQNYLHNKNVDILFSSQDANKIQLRINTQHRWWDDR